MGYCQTGFGAPSPCHFLCHSRVRTWSYIMIRSSVLRQSLPPILCLVLSLFRLFRTLLAICPRGSSALSGRSSSSGKLLDQPPIFRPGFSSLLGIRGRAMSKNAISFYLRRLITDSGAVSSSRPPRAHDILGIATSLNYYSNLCLSPPYANFYVEVKPCLRF